MPHLSTYVGLADHSEKTLAESFREVAEGHARAADVFHTCHLLAQMSDRHRAGARPGEIGLLRDLQDLHVLASLVQTTWTVIAQGAQGLRDPELPEIATTSNAETGRQLSWLTTRIKVAAPQVLIVAP